MTDLTTYNNKRKRSLRMTCRVDPTSDHGSFEPSSQTKIDSKTGKKTDTHGLVPSPRNMKSEPNLKQELCGTVS